MRVILGLASPSHAVGLVKETRLRAIQWKHAVSYPERGLRKVVNRQKPIQR